MLNQINDLIMWIGDVLFGWLLLLPSDVALLIIAVGTGVILVFSRLLCTNQDMLRRCDQDKTRLNQLLREAKRQKDKEAPPRYRASIGQISITTMKAEGLPLLVAIVPIGLLGTWCFERIAFHPPQAGEVVPVVAYFPVSAAGQMVHIVPQAGIQAVSPDPKSPETRDDCWVQEIKAVSDPPGTPPQGVATWHLKAKASAAKDKPYLLDIRYKKGSYQKNKLLVGQRTYASDVEFYEDTPIVCTQIEMRPVKLFGIVPGVDWGRLPGWLQLAPWLVAYFVIAIPSVSLIKRITGIF
jgi:uncharacterized membrane protein (DUF106 family)